MLETEQAPESFMPADTTITDDTVATEDTSQQTADHTLTQPPRDLTQEERRRERRIGLTE